MTVYHWTTKTNYELIKKTGLRKGSFVCAKPSDWHGDVCLQIDDLSLITDDETWQGITHRIVMPNEIKRIV